MRVSESGCAGVRGSRYVKGRWRVPRTCSLEINRKVGINIEAGIPRNYLCGGLLGVAPRNGLVTWIDIERSSVFFCLLFIRFDGKNLSMNA